MNAKKSAMQIFMVLAALGAPAAMAKGLSGSYRVTQTCQTFLQLGDVVVIDARPDSFTYGVEVHTSAGDGVSPQLSTGIGEFTDSRPGPISYGLSLKYVSAYSPDGSIFTFTQTILAGPNQPHDEIIRSVRIAKSNRTLSFQDWEGFGLGPVCELVEQ